MKDEKILAIRKKVFEVFAIAEDKFQSADILYELEKYRESIPLFRDSVLCGIKALLMLYTDDLPDDSHLVDSYYQTEIIKKIELKIGLNEVLKKLRNAEQDSIEHPLNISKESIRDLDICDKQIENFFVKASNLIKESLLTTQEIKKRKSVRKLLVTIFGSIVAIFVLVKGFYFILTLGNGFTGEYFADQNFVKLIKTRIDKKIDFDWGDGRIINNHSNNVYIRWTGKIKTQRIGEYEFITISDDGVRVWIDDKLIIDNWNVHYNTENRATINLKKSYHMIKVEYFEENGSAVMKLKWIMPGTLRPKVISTFYLKPCEKINY